MAILSLGSDTLAVTPVAGTHEYNGQHYLTDSNASRALVERLVQGTAVASTSGTSIDFTGIPSWAKRITVMFNNVSLSGTSNILIQIGLTTPEVTGYLTGSGGFASTSGVSNYTTGFGIDIAGIPPAAGSQYGTAIINLVSGTTYNIFGNFYRAATPAMVVLAGTKVTASIIDRVRITTVNGTDTFDAGSINIMYEG